jgi:hypothetical protein
MACLLRFGAAPAAADPCRPTAEARAAVVAHLRRYQEAFDTHCRRAPARARVTRGG